MKSIAIFCGSNFGNSSLYEEKAYQLGVSLANKKIKIIYGGAKVGLMGAVANGALFAGGEVIGVLPDFIQDKEIAHKHLTKLIIVNSMHERKRIIAELSDGFIALPGGFGTLDELFDVLTLSQLHLHEKPIGIYSINNFYSGIEKQLSFMVKEGFLKEINREILIVENNLIDLLNKMNTYFPPKASKFIK